MHASTPVLVDPKAAAARRKDGQRVSPKPRRQLEQEKAGLQFRKDHGLSTARKGQF